MSFLQTAVRRALGFNRFVPIFLALPLASLTGCGIGTLDTTVAPVSPLVVTGTVHGGETPIIYSKVSFYETAATGVATYASATASGGVYVPASALTPLGSVYTDINGNFKYQWQL